jgi:beta-phosphoglucomutase-like phosphatase (HAD superfamily)
VLIRSEAANLAYYNRLFCEFDLPEVARDDHDRFQRLHTLSTPQVIQEFFPPALQAAARSWADQLGFSPFVRLVQPEPGWDAVLDRWRVRGGAVAVATNRGTSAAEVLGAVDLLSRVDHLVTVKDVARPKPHPDLLFRALQLAGVAATDSIYVGDSALDQEAASRAGIPFVGFCLDSDVTATSAHRVGELLEGFASP